MRRKMHPLTKESLSRFERSGVKVTNEQAIALDKLAEKTCIVHDYKMLKSDFTTVGNLKLYPLTLGASTWLKTDATEWFGDNDTLMPLCLLWASCYSYDLDKFIFDDANKCAKTMIKWGKKIKVDKDKLTKAVETLLYGEESTDAEELLADLLNQILTNPEKLNLCPAMNYLEPNITKGTDKEYGNIPIITYLITNLGGTVEYWLWEHSWENAQLIMKNYNEQQSGDTIVNPHDPSYKAMVNFQAMILKIRSI